MLKKVSVLLTLILMLSFSVCAAAITPDDFTINGINLLTSSYADVIAIMGEPLKKTVDEYGEPALTYLTYKDLRVWTVNSSGQIAYLQADGRDIETARRIKIGATPYKVAKEYGKPEKLSIRGHNYYLYRLDKATNHRLLFDISNGYVSRIILTSLPINP